MGANPRDTWQKRSTTNVVGIGTGMRDSMACFPPGNGMVFSGAVQRVKKNVISTTLEAN